MSATCSCGRQWTGLSQAHCTVCHTHFSTVANFDRHRPSYSGCLHPTEVRNRKGEQLLKPATGPFGVTWVGVGEHPEASGAPGNAADPASGTAA